MMRFVSLTVLSFALAPSLALGQTAPPAGTAAPPAGTTAPAGQMHTQAQCEAMWSQADANNDGFLTEAEGPRYHAGHRWANLPMSDRGLARDSFLSNCVKGVYLDARAEAGAPFKGANSFTENQARDRILSMGLTDVSGLQKDGDGIWRGMAKRSGASHKVAVDYRGNVVVE